MLSRVYVMGWVSVCLSHRPTAVAADLRASAAGTGCLQLLEILEISWRLKLLLENVEIALGI